MRALIVFANDDRNASETRKLLQFAEALYHLQIGCMGLLPLGDGLSPDIAKLQMRQIKFISPRGIFVGVFVWLLAVFYRPSFIVCSDENISKTLRKLNKCPVLPASAIANSSDLNACISAVATAVNQAVVWKLPAQPSGDRSS